jgi:hypothetical protein
MLLPIEVLQTKLYPLPPNKLAVYGKVCPKFTFWFPLIELNVGQPKPVGVGFIGVTGVG